MITHAAARATAHFGGKTQQMWDKTRELTEKSYDLAWRMAARIHASRRLTSQLPEKTET